MTVICIGIKKKSEKESKIIHSQILKFSKKAKTFFSAACPPLSHPATLYDMMQMCFLFSNPHPRKEALHLAPSCAWNSASFAYWLVFRKPKCLFNFIINTTAKESKNMSLTTLLNPLSFNAALTCTCNEHRECIHDMHKILHVVTLNS